MQPSEGIVPLPIEEKGFDSGEAALIDMGAVAVIFAHPVREAQWRLWQVTWR